MRKGMKGVYVPHLLSKYFTMTPFIHFLIVSSLYDVLIERMEYDDTFHTAAHCDFTD
jgi:hypothetical protein